MEPNKLEQEIREKLEGRTINPSPMAWDRLDAMLAVAEEGRKPAKKRGFGWLYMAASFLLMLSVGGYFLLHNNKGVDTDAGKGVTTIVKQTENEGYTNTSSIITPQSIQQRNATQSLAGVQKGSSSSKNNQQQYQTVTETPVRHTAPGFEPVAPAETQMATQTTISSKVKVDANALLASVQTKKPKVTKATQPAVKVDSNALLMDIDQDMETNFRDRMLDKLAKGYGEVKEAVVTRNHN
jgi:hypothetical protein